MATKTMTFYPASFLANQSSLHSSTTAAMYNAAIGKGSDNTSGESSFRLRAGGGTITAYYAFDLSKIPEEAAIDSVVCYARVSLTTTANTKTISLCSGTTKKASTTITSTGATVYSVSGGSWTRDELRDCRLLFTVTFNGSGTHYLYFYGADLVVTYTYRGEEFLLKLGGSWHNVARVFKKVNGIWVEQESLEGVVDTSKKLVNGGEIN